MEKKECDQCKGKGQINGRYVEEWHNVSWVPTDCQLVQVWKSDDCPKCKGKGYLTLDWR